MFWKIVVIKGGNGPEVFGFVLKQSNSLVDSDLTSPEAWRVYRHSIAGIEGMLNGWVKLTWLKKYDQFGTVREVDLPESLRPSPVVATEGLAEVVPEQTTEKANVETAASLAGTETAEGFIQGATFQNRKVQFNVLNNRAIFEGDIDLGSLDELSSSFEVGLESIGITGQKYRWANREIPYTIDASLPNQTRVADAISHWERNTQIRFIRRTHQVNYVTFRPGSGCSSSVGCRGGQQFVTLGPNCSLGNAIHEIGHTVGLWHEQCRQDRDRFVTIDFSNIQAGTEPNFWQQISDGDDLGGYDYGSIMHYPRNAFAKDPSKPTIITPNGEAIGQRVGLSPGDIAGVKAMYP